MSFDECPSRVAHELRAQRVCSMRLFCESRLPWRPDSHESSGENGERPGHLDTVLADHLRDGIRLACRGQSRQAHEKDAEGDSTQAEHEFAEILVGGHEDALIGVGELKHGLVGDARRELGNVDDVGPSGRSRLTMAESTPSSARSFTPPT